MRINLLGSSGETIGGELDAAGVVYKYHVVQATPGKADSARLGDWLELVEKGTPWAALAIVLCDWVGAKATRDVMIETDESTIVHAREMSVDDVKKVVATAKSIGVLDTAPPKNPEFKFQIFKEQIARLTVRRTKPPQ
jgi:hypothetical protein